MLKPSLCDYRDAYILVRGNIAVDNTGADGDTANNTNKKIILTNPFNLPFTDWISEANNTQKDNAKYIDIVMSIYNLIEYIDNSSQKFRSLWHYCKDIPAVNNNADIVDFNGTNATDTIYLKAKITGQTGNNGRIIDYVDIMVILKYLSNNLWRTLEMSLN